MEKLRALIVDDEPLARRRIRSLLQDGAELEVVGECADGRQAITAIRSQNPQLLFLDVQLPELDGFGVLQALEPSEMPAVVFMTSYDQRALRTFQAHGLDYLVKPFDRARVEAAVIGARARLNGRPDETFNPAFLSMLRDMTTKPMPIERFRVRARGRVLLLRAEEVDWIDGRGNYAQLHIGGEVHRLRERLKELERELDPGRFLRVHRSRIVNVDRVRELRQTPQRQYRVVLSDGTELPSSRSYQTRLKEFFSAHH
jgi:two-component system LytT family response regulator